MDPLLIALFVILLLFVFFIWLALHHKLSSIETTIAGELATARGSINAVHGKLDAVIAAAKGKSP